MFIMQQQQQELTVVFHNLIEGHERRLERGMDACNSPTNQTFCCSLSEREARDVENHASEDNELIRIIINRLVLS